MAGRVRVRSGAVVLAVTAVLAFGLATLAAETASAANVFPGQNGVLVFERDFNQGSDLITINPNGQGETNLTNNNLVAGPTNRDTSPSWGPDGSDLLFGRDPAGSTQSDIFTMGFNGANPTQLTNTPNTFDGEATFNRTGNLIAFTSGSGSDLNIFGMNADGTGQRPVTSGAGQKFNPSFSPVNDNLLLFNGESGNDTLINQINFDGSGLLPLTTSGDAFGGSFSPDGQTIVFPALNGGDVDLFSINANGTNMVQLTSGPGLDLYGTYSPDGAKLAFSRSQGGMSRIFIADANGANAVALTNGPNDFAPAWQALNPPQFEFKGDGRIDEFDFAAWRVGFGSELMGYDASGLVSGPDFNNRAAFRTKVNLKPASGDLAVGETEKIKLKVPKKGQKLLNAAAEEGKKVKITVTVIATDNLGATTEKSQTTKLKPKK